jgi:hypothetical protein
MDIFKNKIVQILLIVCVIVGICLMARLNFHVVAGSDGVNVGVDRTK